MKILLITAGPERLGQSGELDQSAYLAAQAWRERGHRVIVAANDPAAPLMTSQAADRIYCTPLTVAAVTEIIATERPEGVCLAFGGVIASNLGRSLAKVLVDYQVKLLGSSEETLRLCEERASYTKILNEAGLKVPSGRLVTTSAAISADFPVVVRVSEALEGMGVTLAYNQEELAVVISESTNLSLPQQVWLEESLLGWREFEVELLRDQSGQVLPCALLEKVEAVGVHRGNSLLISPVQGVASATQAELVQVAIQASQALKVVGVANVQLAYQPETAEILVLEVKPRFTRSTALATEISGLPLAALIAWVSLGLKLVELAGDDQGILQPVRETTGVYLRLPRFDFERASQARILLDTRLQALGEITVYADNFKAAFQKGLRALEIGVAGFGAGADVDLFDVDEVELRMELINPTPKRYFYLYQALKGGFKVAEINQLSQLPHWFLQELFELVAFEKQLTTYAIYNLDQAVLRQAKEWGFSDAQVASLLRVTVAEIRETREKLGIIPGMNSIFQRSAQIPRQLYLSYQQYQPRKDSRNKVLVLGGGVHRIGSGKEIEFALREAEQELVALGRQVVILHPNRNAFALSEAESVLYLEALELETVLEIVRLEGIEQVMVLCLTERNQEIATALISQGIEVLGIPSKQNEQELSRLLTKLKLIDLKENDLEKINAKFNQEHFLAEARGVMVTCLADGEQVVLCGILEQIESVGVNPGDSAFALPAYTLSKRQLEQIQQVTVGLAMNYRGMINLYYLLYQEQIFLAELQAGVNFLTPTLNYGTEVNWVRAAIKVLLGVKLAAQAISEVIPSETTIREVVFPFQRGSLMETTLGHEMRSLGNVCGKDAHFGKAFLEAQLAAGEGIPFSGKIYLSIREEERRQFLELAKQLVELDFILLAGRELASFLKKHGISVAAVAQVGEGRPNILDHLKNHEVAWVINTASQKQLGEEEIRSTALRLGVPLTTTLTAVKAAVAGLQLM